jgi:hypothetical protein
MATCKANLQVLTQWRGDVRSDLLHSLCPDFEGRRVHFAGYRYASCSIKCAWQHTWFEIALWQSNMFLHGVLQLIW